MVFKKEIKSEEKKCGLVGDGNLGVISADVAQGCWSSCSSFSCFAGFGCLFSVIALS